MGKKKRNHKDVIGIDIKKNKSKPSKASKVLKNVQNTSVWDEQQQKIVHNFVYPRSWRRNLIIPVSFDDFKVSCGAAFCPCLSSGITHFSIRDKDGVNLGETCLPYSCFYCTSFACCFYCCACYSLRRKYIQSHDIESAGKLWDCCVSSCCCACSASQVYRDFTLNQLYTDPDRQNELRRSLLTEFDRQMEDNEQRQKEREMKRGPKKQKMTKEEKIEHERRKREKEADKALANQMNESDIAMQKLQEAAAARLHKRRSMDTSKASTVAAAKAAVAAESSETLPNTKSSKPQLAVSTSPHTPITLNGSKQKKNSSDLKKAHLSTSTNEHKGSNGDLLIPKVATQHKDHHDNSRSTTSNTNNDDVPKEWSMMDDIEPSTHDSHTQEDSVSASHTRLSDVEVRTDTANTANSPVNEAEQNDDSKATTKANTDVTQDDAQPSTKAESDSKQKKEDTRGNKRRIAHERRKSIQDVQARPTHTFQLDDEGDDSQRGMCRACQTGNADNSGSNNNDCSMM